ncbi:hypothetical protein Rhe02_73630 [Rhizocola hellebori]|uniref:PKD domain containing protein n=1 Tax=Rhizocola hellebori TaxID=1392758 RepID=A0A8J3VKQ2_9ACTN|nr:PKD domain containing protein [Rhizocola hellebori]GIH09296.1 hypothetical protein Rhe02_73630 [Rhizocola hellebori]
MRRLLVASLTALLAFAAPAAASSGGSQVTADPVDWTPHVLDGDIRAIAVVGDTVVVGGDFTTVSDSEGDATYERWYLFAFSLSTGEVLPFEPYLDGPVMALEPGPDNTVYVGGRFEYVADRRQRGITQLDLESGWPVDRFRAGLDWGDVRGIQATPAGLFIGGTFGKVNGISRVGLARLDGVTGAVDPRFDAKLSAKEIGRVKVEDIAVSPAGDRLMAVGAITQAGSDERTQAAMFDLTTGRATLSGWSTEVFKPKCREGFDTYMRAVDFSPAGDYFVIVTTGRSSSPTSMCDVAARFETYRSGPQQPTWVNHTGGDSLYAVEVGPQTVYVGGHQRWMDNPEGHESAGPGAVNRVGLASIDPVTGRATDWNPTRSRGVGVRAFALTDRGLFVGSDTDVLAREYHGRIGMFPY